MLRNNICTADGLVNGVVGTIVGSEHPDDAREPGVHPSGMNIIFDNPRVGKETRGSDGVCLIGVSTSSFRNNITAWMSMFDWQAAPSEL